jgi:hypothetical protein
MGLVTLLPYAVLQHAEIAGMRQPSMAGVLNRLITPIIEKAKSDGALVASLACFIIATCSHAPYAVSNIVSPLLTVAVAFAGFRMQRLPVDAPVQIATGPATG